MRKWLDKTTALVLCGALVLVACGGDDDEAAPVEPEPEPVAEITPEIIGLYGTLVSSFTNIFLAAIVAPPGETVSIPGVSGAVEVTDNEWVIKDFSPDGALVFNGTLTVDKAKVLEQMPVPVTGSVTFSGSQEGELTLDMQITVGADGSLSTTGTITIDGAEFDVAELSAAAAAAAAAAEAAG